MTTDDTDAGNMPRGAVPANPARARVEAAVVVPLFRDDRGELRLVLVVRNLAGAHGGQVALPGGKRERGDCSPLAAALREAEEEIGLGRSEVEILAALEPVDTRTTGFRVHPFIARIRVPPKWQCAPGEITTVLTPAVDDLDDCRRRDTTLASFPNWPKPRRVERVLLEDGYTVWGFTLRLLDSILPRVLSGEWCV